MDCFQNCFIFDYIIILIQTKERREIYCIREKKNKKIVRSIEWAMTSEFTNFLDSSS